MAARIPLPTSRSSHKCHIHIGISTDKEFPIHPHHTIILFSKLISLAYSGENKLPMYAEGKSKRRKQKRNQKSFRYASLLPECVYAIFVFPFRPIHFHIPFAAKYDDLVHPSIL
jgi:hypothetical protein